MFLKKTRYLLNAEVSGNKKVNVTVFCVFRDHDWMNLTDWHLNDQRTTWDMIACSLLGIKGRPQMSSLNFGEPANGFGPFLKYPMEKAYRV
jgi:hypothetical protein